jgi:hypothetical protein
MNLSRPHILFIRRLGRPLGLASALALAACGSHGAESEDSAQQPFIVTQYHPIAQNPQLSFASTSPAVPMWNSPFMITIRLTNPVYTTYPTAYGLVQAELDGVALSAGGQGVNGLPAGQSATLSFNSWTAVAAGPHTIHATFKVVTDYYFDPWSGKADPLYNEVSSDTSTIQVAGGLPGPKFNEVQQAAVHNSYYVVRDNVVELEASGPSIRILDQLLFEHARALEIDVHKDNTTPHNWTVYHTNDQANSLCTPLSECLKQLQVFHRAVPNHEVVTVVLELKEIFEYNFDDQHTPGDLDAILESHLGSAMYRPRDFLARCQPGSTLSACAQAAGWPSIAELRGKFMFLVIGNWRANIPWETCKAVLGQSGCAAPLDSAWSGHGPEGWVHYASWSGGANTRSAFLIASNFVRYNGGPATEQVDPAALEAARRASLFLQAEDSVAGSYPPNDPCLATDAHFAQLPNSWDLSNRGLWGYSSTNGCDNSGADPGITGFLAGGGIVRGRESFSIADQQDRLNRGFQLLMSDYPYLQTDNRGALQPLRPMPTQASRYSDRSFFDEPGNRLLLLRSGDADPARTYFASRTESGVGTVAWSAAVSSTRLGNSDYPNPRFARGIGCFRAAASLDASADAVTLCRQTAQGDANVSKPLEQDDIITVDVVSGGQSTRSTFYSPANTTDGPGDLLRLEVDVNADQTSCARAFSIGAVPSGSNWGTPLVSVCTPTALVVQGLAGSYGDVLFAGAMRAADGAADQPVQVTDLSAPSPVVPVGETIPAMNYSGYMLVDQSGPARRCANGGPGRPFTAPDGECVVPVYRGQGGNGAGSVFANDPADASAWGFSIDPATTFFVAPYNAVTPELLRTSQPVALVGCPNVVDPFWHRWIDRPQLRVFTPCSNPVGLGYILGVPSPGMVPLYEVQIDATNIAGTYFTLDPTDAPASTVAERIGYVWPSSAVY